MADTIPSTLTPAEVAVKMIEHGVAKHRTRLDKVFFKSVRSTVLFCDSIDHTQSTKFIAGAYLSFGGLLSEVIQGGSPDINTNNPGLLKVMGGFVFPVGLVM